MEHKPDDQTTMETAGKNKRRRIFKVKNIPWIEAKEEFLFIDLKRKTNTKIHQELVTQQIKAIKKLKIKLRGTRLKVRMIKKRLNREKNELDDLMRAEKKFFSTRYCSIFCLITLLINIMLW